MTTGSPVPRQLLMSDPAHVQPIAAIMTNHNHNNINNSDYRACLESSCGTSENDDDDSSSTSSFHSSAWTDTDDDDVDDSSSSSLDYAELELDISQVLTASKRLQLSTLETNKNYNSHKPPSSSMKRRNANNDKLPPNQNQCRNQDSFTSAGHLDDGDDDDDVASRRIHKSSSSVSASSGISCISEDSGIDMDDEGTMASIREDLLKLGTLLASRKGDAFRERALVLASINYLARNVPCCVLDHLGREVRQADHRSLFHDQRTPSTASYSSSSMSSSSPTDNWNNSCLLLDDDSKITGYRTLTKIQSLDAQQGVILDLPLVAPFQGAVLFVDIVGFTVLSTRLGSEVVSKAINKYLELLIAGVFDFDGDIQKFAGDAFFAEWRVTPNRTLEECAKLAAICTCKLAKDMKNFPVTVSHGNKGDEIINMNFRCGLGIGEMVGIHIGDNERRQYLHIGTPIAQATDACKLADSGEVVVSPIFFDCISGTKVRNFISMIHHQGEKITLSANTVGFGAIARRFVKKPEEIARSRAITHRVEGLGLDSLKEYRRLIALYCHPVVRAGGIFDQKSLPGMKQQKRRLPDEPEMRNVFVAFLNVALPLHRSTDVGGIDKLTVQKINRILNLVSRELLHFRGYVESFIDDKGFSLMITFGLRGSMFPNLVPNVALPAVLNVMDVLSSEANVRCRIGATYGNVHCGFLGANERHEYTVLGPSVNLAARLMTSELNQGLLVDDSVRIVPGCDLSFEKIGTVVAKGYTRSIVAYSPVFDEHVDEQPSNCSCAFVGRELELDLILHEVDECSLVSRMMFVAGSTGLGKSTLLSRASTLIAEKAREVGNGRIRLENLCGTSKNANIPFAALGVLLDSLQQCVLIATSLLEGRKSSTTRPTNILELFGVAHQDLRADGDDEALNDLTHCVSQALAHCFQDVDLLVIAIDDCHRLDKYSWRTLAHLMESTKGVFILATTTTVSPHGFHMDVTTESLIFDTFQQDGLLSMLELDNFTFNEVKTLVSDTFKLDEVPMELLQSIYTESGGQPLFVKQVVDRLKGSEKHEQCEDILLHRLDCLQFAERRCLTIAACLGNAFSLVDVEHILLDDAAVGGDDAIPCAATLEALVRLGIICSHVGTFGDNNFVNNDSRTTDAVGTSTGGNYYCFRDDRWRKKILELTLKSAQLDVSRLVATRRYSEISAGTVKM